MRFFNLLWALPATLAIGAIWCVSAYANYSFGLSLGSDLFGYASLAVDVAKAVILFGAFAAIAHRHYLASATLMAIWVCCSLWGIASAIGFVSTHYATMTDNRGKTAEEWTQLESQIASLKERRKSVSAARPEGVVQSEIDGLMREVESCAVINGPVTRSLCPKVDRLKAELANAKSASWLDGRLDELRKEMKITAHVSSVDPRADALAGILGLASPMLAKGLAGFFALMMELITATGLWAVWKAFGATIQAKRASGPEALDFTASAAAEFAASVGNKERPVKFRGRSAGEIEIPVVTRPDVTTGPNEKLTAMYGRYRAVEDAKANAKLERLGEDVRAAVAALSKPASDPTVKPDLTVAPSDKPFSRDHENGVLKPPFYAPPENGPDPDGGKSAPVPQEPTEAKPENVVTLDGEPYTPTRAERRKGKKARKAKAHRLAKSVQDWIEMATAPSQDVGSVRLASKTQCYPHYLKFMKAIGQEHIPPRHFTTELKDIFGIDERQHTGGKGGTWIYDLILLPQEKWALPAKAGRWPEKRRAVA
jgi:hypothetical protein